MSCILFRFIKILSIFLFKPLLDIRTTPNTFCSFLTNVFYYSHPLLILSSPSLLLPLCFRPQWPRRWLRRRLRRRSSPQPPFKILNPRKSLVLNRDLLRHFHCRCISLCTEMERSVFDSGDTVCWWSVFGNCFDAFSEWCKRDVWWFDW